MKRLSVPTGNIDEKTPIKSESDSVTRHAILVHSGPNGKAITFMSGDGEISFDDARIKDIVKNHNAKIENLAEGYGGMDKMPIGAFPPILDQHVDDSTDRVRGRLNSLLSYEKRDVPGVGKNCSCLMGDVTFIGKDTVERVGDGRIYHLSIGIDEETNTLGETSIVITPAAPGAMLLKKGDKKMALKKLEAHKSKMAKLKAMKDGLAGLTKKVVAANENVKLAKKNGEISHRLRSLVKGGRLLPADLKTEKFSVKNLSSKSQESLDLMFEALESQQPKVLVGQRGTSAALAFSDIGKSLEKRQQTRMKAEVLGDMKKLGAKGLNKGLGFDKEEDKEDNVEHKMGAEKEVEGSPDMEKHMACMMDMKKCLDAGNIEEAKKHHEAAMAHLAGMGVNEESHLELGDVKSEDVKKTGEEFQIQIDELNTQVARIAGMVEDLISVEQGEGEEMEAEGQKHEDLSSGFADENSKKLAEEEEAKKLEKEEEDKKKLEKEEEVEKKKLAKEEKEAEKKLEKEEEDKKKLAKEEEEKEEVKKELKKALKKGSK